jgi:hypothetical protein
MTCFYQPLADAHQFHTILDVDSRCAHKLALIAVQQQLQVETQQMAPYLQNEIAVDNGVNTASAAPQHADDEVDAEAATMYLGDAIPPAPVPRTVDDGVGKLTSEFAAAIRAMSTAAERLASAADRDDTASQTQRAQCPQQQQQR